MKRILLTLICFIFLVGCGEKQEVEVTIASVSFDAAITYGSHSLACEMTLSEGAVMHSEVKAPESIAGTTLTYDGETLKINYKGLEYVPELPIEQETANDIINKIFRSVATGGKNAQKEDGNFVLRDEVAGKEFTLYVTEAGLPLSLTCPDASLTAEFSNVTVK